MCGVSKCLVVNYYYMEKTSVQMVFSGCCLHQKLYLFCLVSICGIFSFFSFLMSSYNTHLCSKIFKLYSRPEIIHLAQWLQL